jgi:hypothetical protein
MKLELAHPPKILYGQYIVCRWGPPTVLIAAKQDR